MDKRRKEIIKANIIDTILQFFAFCGIIAFVMAVMFGGGEMMW